jgi:alkylation response protein AidB-like acyl-CoA dehydrogenase
LSNNEDLLRRATDLLPKLKKRALETERLRRLPRETVDDLVASQLIRLGVPDRFGGIGPDYDRAYPIAAELARGCAASAWCYSLWAVHAWMVGHMPEPAQAEFFANGPDVLCSSSFATTSSVHATRCGDGWRLDGRWEFSSGCDHAEWFLLGTGTPGELALVPRSDVEVLDTWQASGLCGSGSHDVVVDNARVPGHRLLNIDRAGVDDFTGWELHQRPTYRVPLRTMLAWDLVAPLLGVAQATLDEFVRRIQVGETGAYMARSEVIQFRVAEAAAEVEAARALMHHRLQWVLAKAARGERFSELERMTVARDRAFVVRLCMQAVNGLFDVSGGHALFLSDPLQRAHRDAQAIAHRAGLTLEIVGPNYGRVALTPPPTD